MVFGSANTNYVLPENIEQHIIDGYKLIDVREDDEWNAGHHSGAKHIPMSTIPENLNSFEESEKYISNITNMRDNIRSVGKTELNFLPLWMRTSQPGAIETLGYVKAIPLCYVKPGNSTQIINALNSANIKFNQFDFDVDRYVIDSTTGNSNEQYLLFHNYEYNV